MPESLWHLPQHFARISHGFQPRRVQICVLRPFHVSKISPILYVKKVSRHINALFVGGGDKGCQLRKRQCLNFQSPNKVASILYSAERSENTHTSANGRIKCRLPGERIGSLNDRPWAATVGPLFRPTCRSAFGGVAPIDRTGTAIGGGFQNGGFCCAVEAQNGFHAVFLELRNQTQSRTL